MLKTEALALVLTMALCGSVVTVQAARRAPGHPMRRPKTALKAPVPLNLGDQILVNGQLWQVLPVLAPNNVADAALTHSIAPGKSILRDTSGCVSRSNVFDLLRCQYRMTVLLARVHSPLFGAISEVRRISSQEQMGGIAAPPVVASVEDKQPLRDRPKVDLPGNAVGGKTPAIAHGPRADPHPSVALPADTLSPQPTCSSFTDRVPETRGNRPSGIASAAPGRRSDKIVSHRKPSFPVSGGGSGDARLPNRFDKRKRKSLPGAAPIVLQMGDSISVGGQIYTIGVGLIPATAPPPPPPPPAPTLTGYAPNPVGGGQPFTLQGSGFTDSSATATWNGQTLGLIVTSPTSLSTTAPGVTSAQTAPVILTSSGTRLIGPLLTVTPSIGPAPDMTVYAFRNGNRDYATVFGPGQVIYILGKGFGPLAGTVAINHKQTPIGAWSDTEIRTIIPPLDTGQGPGPATLDIIRSDHGSYNSSQAFVILPPPGRFGNR